MSTIAHSENVNSLLWKLGPSVLALARWRRLDSASSKLGINRTTLQRQIEQLELHLNFKLFIGNLGEYLLTEKGVEIMLLLEKMEDALSGVDTVLLGDNSQSNKKIRISLPPHVLPMVSNSLEGYMCRSQDACLELHVSYELTEMRFKEYDIALRISLKEPEYPLVTAYELPLHGCYCQARNLDFNNAHYVLNQFETEPEDWLRNRFGRLPIIKCQDYATQLQLLANNGVGRTIRELAEINPDIDVVGEPAAHLGYKLFVVNHAATRFMPHIKRMTDDLIGHIQSRSYN